LSVEGNQFDTIIQEAVDFMSRINSFPDIDKLTASTLSDGVGEYKDSLEKDQRTLENEQSCIKLNIDQLVKFHSDLLNCKMTFEKLKKKSDLKKDFGAEIGKLILLQSS
jgi:hypothetical protein